MGVAALNEADPGFHHHRQFVMLQSPKVPKLFLVGIRLSVGLERTRVPNALVFPRIVSDFLSASVSHHPHDIGGTERRESVSFNLQTVRPQCLNTSMFAITLVHGTLSNTFQMRSFPEDAPTHPPLPSSHGYCSQTQRRIYQVNLSPDFLLLTLFF